MQNSKLDTGKKYIKDLYSSDCFYNIPEYQRPYVWGEEQINVLLDDLFNAYENGEENNERKEYFIGCMIWNSRKINESKMSYTCHDILDGQQRFITLYLLQGVMRDLSTNKKLQKKVQERLRQEQDEFDAIPARSRIEFSIREDREFLEKFLLEPAGTLLEEELEIIIDESESISEANMASAIFTIQEWFHEHRKSDNFQEFLNNFFRYISTKVLTLYLATPDNLDDAYNLFTVLNSRGLQLQIGDILKAQNLREISDAKVRKRYAEKWLEYENAIESPYRNFDDFLWAIVNITMKYRSDENQSLKGAFDFMYKKELLYKGKKTFDYIETYLKHYRTIMEGNIRSQDNRFLFKNLVTVLNSVFGSQYIPPLMHYLECFGNYKVVDFLIKIDNLFSAHWLSGRRQLQTRIFIILRKMDEILKQKGDKKSLVDTFLQDDVLKYDYDDKNANTMLDIEDFFTLLSDEPWGSFAGTKINKTRYLLLKLDILMGGENTRLHFERTSSSVEHLMPRKIKNSKWKVKQEDHSEWVHSLGNIVLIDRKKNSAFSNKSYPEKKEIYKSVIEARANTNYVFIKYPQWNIEAIKQNQKRIEKVLRQYYEGNSIETFLEIKKSINS
ncbi:DUF262 domain-containing protein [Candidatus Uabimicrobium amorphum]|uniref:DUF262 domain-containing protein n=1 Tax=Uabimicrobium amorphum TaxID=2596890 RepID=A0A5S9IKR3_UABAM|nr:DUF262 domain-containing protein [Candidatus Uabimicrobium amorphum]BBM83350.1 hypothetical protein UABAM_01702 [Candidatus Uabimicrobium amorphum]